MSKIRASHILVKKQGQAEELLNQLKSVPEGNRLSLFKKLAQQHSTCSSAKKGGDLSTFGRGQMVKEFEKAAFALEKGQMSGLVKTQFGYHIILRTG
ncbi:MAG: peptidylprolyl isomerase [Candidatus Heimdallarchaeota archaeon]|nr:peptidylprolyl isomerase [Candidatus Heimdallarchaeota archaeon]